MDESALVEDRCGADRGMDFEALEDFFVLNRHIPLHLELISHIEAEIIPFPARPRKTDGIRSQTYRYALAGILPADAKLNSASVTPSRSARIFTVSAFRTRSSSRFCVTQM